jgi:UDP-glucose 6-dehydrogenase
LGADYSKVKDTAVRGSRIADKYLDCNQNFRGFGGVCLPKDTAALDFLAKNLGTNVKFFENILTENSKYKTTVFEGMRKA